MPKFWLVPLHKMLALAACTFVDWLRKLPSKEQQLSRTQHFILSPHATLFGLRTIRPMQNTADPYGMVWYGMNYLLSTHCTLNKFCPLMIFCNHGFSQNGAPFATYFVLKIYPTSCENGVSEHAVARFGQFDVLLCFFHKMRHFS